MGQSPPFACVSDGVVDDVGHVCVFQRVDDLLTASLRGNESRAPEHPQVLRDERLGDAERRNENMDALRTLSKLENDAQPVGMRQRREQLACGAKTSRPGPVDDHPNKLLLLEHAHVCMTTKVSMPSRAREARIRAWMHLTSGFLGFNPVDSTKGAGYSAGWPVADLN
jgi:hypothetical protein